MPADSIHVRTERAHNRDMFTGGVNAAFDAGEIDGADANPNALPPWAWAILSKLTAWQRGYLLGVLLSEDERNGEK